MLFNALIIPRLSGRDYESVVVLLLVVILPDSTSGCSNICIFSSFLRSLQEHLDASTDYSRSYSQAGQIYIDTG